MPLLLKSSKIKKKNSKKPTKKKSRMRALMKDSLADENTTNSDTSENNMIFNDINWEENIGVDSTELLDEFAPRPTEPESKGQEEKKPEEPPKETPKKGSESTPSKKASSAPSTSHGINSDLEQEYSLGAALFVMDYSSHKWNAATISEVDWEEEEIFVEYTESKTKEWVSMNSQRVSRTKPDSLILMEQHGSSSPTPSEAIGGNSSSQDTGEFLGFQSSPVLPEEKHTSTPPTQTSTPKPSRSSSNKNRLKPKSPGGPKVPVKFKVGEKVLAKWSDHRMQKFPAVVKNVIGDGTYDVLFYDGFERNLRDDNIFKASEEEVEKYQHSNPSEADSFIEMDAGSKEARRQRKKKTFDGFIFEKDLSKGRKRPGPGEAPFRQRQKEPPATIPKAERRIEESPSCVLKKTPPPSLPRVSLGKRSHKKKKPKREEESFSDVSHTSSPIPKIPSEPLPSSVEKVNSPKIESTSAVVEPATPATLNENEEQKQAMGDLSEDEESSFSIPKKAILIPDNRLPSGWTRHAMLRKGGTIWEAFLTTPEGFRLTTQEDLEDYFHERLKTTIPDYVDFSIDPQLLSELCSQQRGVTPGLESKKLGGRGRRKSSSLSTSSAGQSPSVEGSQAVGRVKTLLPKCRTTSPQPPVAASPPTQAVPSPSSQLPAYSTQQTSVPPSDGENWRCPKQGCDKKFRKENLLQMHIKHYHVEFKALVGSAPNVVDLALARSESANSEWTPDTPKNAPQHPSVKKATPTTRSVPSSQMNFQSGDGMDYDPHPPSILPSTQPPPTSRLELTNEGIIKRVPIVDERKATIKTMFPLRTPGSDSQMRSGYDSEEFETDDDYMGDGQRHLKTLKPSRSKKMKLEPRISGPLPVDESTIREPIFPMSPSYKFPKKKLPAIDKLLIATDSNDSFPDEEKISPNMDIGDDGVIIERLKSEEFINCTCGYREEDGLMVQCDICTCWQHGFCAGFEKDSDVPEQYVCYICKHPTRVRMSKKYDYMLQYLTEGKLPSLSFRTRNRETIKQREEHLKKCFELSASLHNIQTVERSLRAKVNILEQPNHPKLYLWAKSWEEPTIKQEPSKDFPEDVMIKEEDVKPSLPIIPEPEAPIDPDECRVRLIDHIEHYYQQLDDRLTSLQAQIAALEAQDPDLSSDQVSDRMTKHTLKMLIRDLTTVHRLANIPC